MTLLRTFIVWLLLLALPYQGYASAAMMSCAPVAPASAHLAMSAGAHDHAAMMAAMRDHKQEASTDKSGHAHGGIKCGGSACCVAGAPFMAQALAVPMLPVASSAIPFHSEVLRAVDLAHPERPPQGHFA